MDHSFTNPTICAADTDVFIGSTESTHRMTFEMRQRYHGIIIQHMISYRHLSEPFSVFYRKHGGSFFIHDVYRAECPAIHLQCLAVCFCCITVAFVISVCLDDRYIRQFFLHQMFYPLSRDDIWTVFLTGMQLDTYFSFDIATYPFIYFL